MARVGYLNGSSSAFAAPSVFIARAVNPPHRQIRVYRQRFAMALRVSLIFSADAFVKAA
jgi:hypothetical protein